jgi:hypothetical protein
MPVEVIVAVISASAAAAAAFFTFRMQRQLEVIKGSLAEAQAERDAQRDYTYEARKRLYSEIQPLLFQLMELSESAYRWVMGLARTARQGQLSWLSKGYYLRMTIYRLTAPLAVFRLIQRRLTVVDLTVDVRLRIQYNIAKQIYFSVSDGFTLASVGDYPIPYDPHHVRRWRGYEPSVHTQQHLFRGHLDMIADALVVREQDGLRCMTYGEFETQFLDTNSDVYRATHALAAGFSEFDPRSRPVVWRMLIVQVYFHKALLYTFQQTAAVLGSPAELLSKEERLELDWRQASQGAPNDEEVLVWPFNAAEAYVRRQLPGLFSH